jgi:hypothetical protein
VANNQNMTKKGDCGESVWARARAWHHCLEAIIGRQDTLHLSLAVTPPHLHQTLLEARRLLSRNTRCFLCCRPALIRIQLLTLCRLQHALQALQLAVARLRGAGHSEHYEETPSFSHERSELTGPCITGISGVAFSMCA